MKFIYEYRTSDNVPHQDMIVSASREAAFAELKARGIKPSKVWEAPGLMNKLFGKGKRWLAIVVLLFVLLGVTTVTLMMHKEVSIVNRELEDLTLFEERAQIYGAQTVISEMEADNYLSVFGTDGVARFLAMYAIPARSVKDKKFVMPSSLTRKQLSELVVIREDDLDEVKHLKRMVNRMKREMGRYLDAGGSVGGYLKRLDIRQETEQRILTRVKGELQRETNAEVWREKNAQLRAMGLPMVDPPAPVEQQ